MKGSRGWKNDFSSDKRDKGCVQCCASKTRCKTSIWIEFLINMSGPEMEVNQSRLLFAGRKIANVFQGRERVRKGGKERKNLIFVWMELMNAWEWKTEETYTFVMRVPNYCNKEYKIIALIIMAHRPEWMAATICAVAWITYTATYRLNILRCIKTVGNVDGET